MEAARSLKAGVVGVVMFLTVAPSAMATTLGLSVQSVLGFNIGLTPASDTQGTTGSSGNLSLQSTLSDAYTDPSGAFRSGSVFSSGSLKVGAIRLFSHADATSLLAPGIGHVASTAKGFAGGSWNDAFTINGTLQQNGQIGHFDAGVLVDGTGVMDYIVDASVNNPASLREYFRAVLSLTTLSGAPTVSGGQERDIDFTGNQVVGPFGGPLLAPGLYPIGIDFRFGTPIQVHGSLEVQTFAQAIATSAFPSSSLSSTVDFGHTMQWNGITGITDSQGNPVTNYSVSSDSGFDYRFAPQEPHAVPVPATILLLGTGLSGLLCFRAKPTTAPSRRSCIKLLKHTTRRSWRS